MVCVLSLATMKIVGFDNYSTGLGMTFTVVGMCNAAACSLTGNSVYLLEDVNILALNFIELYRIIIIFLQRLLVSRILYEC